MLGIGSNGQHKLCHKQQKAICAKSESTNKAIHQIALSWKVNDEETLFEKPMPTNENELKYHQLQFSITDLEKARALCGNVSLSQKKPKLHQNNRNS